MSHRLRSALNAVKSGKPHKTYRNCCRDKNVGLTLVHSFICSLLFKSHANILFDSEGIHK